MRLFFKMFLTFFGLLFLVFIFGPRTEFDRVDSSPISLQIPLNKIDKYISDKESQILNIKPGNQAQIIWAQPQQRSAYAIVYLHGFTASHGEGFPVTHNIGSRYGMNVLLSRLSQHGLSDENSLLNMTPTSLLNSAKEAIAIGKLIGEKVILLSCSTGSTLGIYLSNEDPDIVAHIMTSPNIEIYDKRAKLFTYPWGKQVFRYVVGSDYRTWNASQEAQKWWTTKNRIEGYIALQNLLEQTMLPSVFEKTTMPLFVGYYFKDEDHQDKTISVDAILEYVNQVNTPQEQLKVIPFSSPTGHVLTSTYMNPNWEEVQDSIYQFIDSRLEIKQKSSKNLVVFIVRGF